MNAKNKSNSVIRRLPRYYRFLLELEKGGATKTSSKELSKRMRATASQVRQDLNCFGDFGQQGYGYNVALLREEIGRILGLDQPKSAILIGMGNLGRAVAQHINFESKGFYLIGTFDCKESLVGQVVRNIPIRNISALDEFCKENKPKAAILCIPKEAAEEISSQLISLGVKAFLNFSHYDILVNNTDVLVENIHFGDSLMTLSYKLNEE